MNFSPKVVYLSKYKHAKKKNSSTLSPLQQAFAKLKEDTGIDHEKMLMGDEKEKQKWKQKLHEDSLRVKEDE